MKSYSSLSIVFAFLATAVLVSCNKESTTFSVSTNNVSPTPPPQTTPVFSALDLVNSTDQVFNFLKVAAYPISCNNTYCTIRSRYILRSNGSFLLQYNYDQGNVYSWGIQYKGNYTQTGNEISFTWEGWSVTGPWGATGTLNGDTLTVRYNMIMTMSDFEDGVYLRQP